MLLAIFKIPARESVTGGAGDGEIWVGADDDWAF